MTGLSRDMPIEQAVERLLADLSLKPLRLGWAKMEILVGLASVAIGSLLGVCWITRSDTDWVMVVTAVCLFVLGGYLALAGHRSLLYQSNNKLVAHLAELIRQNNQTSQPI